MAVPAHSSITIPLPLWSYVGRLALDILLTSASYLEKSFILLTLCSFCMRLPVRKGIPLSPTCMHCTKQLKEQRGLVFYYPIHSLALKIYRPPHVHRPSWLYFLTFNKLPVSLSFSRRDRKARQNSESISLSSLHSLPSITEFCFFSLLVMYTSGSSSAMKTFPPNQAAAKLFCFLLSPTADHPNGWPGSVSTAPTENKRNSQNSSKERCETKRLSSSVQFINPFLSGVLLFYKSFSKQKTATLLLAMTE